MVSKLTPDEIARDRRILDEAGDVSEELLQQLEREVYGDFSGDETNLPMIASDPYTPNYPPIPWPEDGRGKGKRTVKQSLTVRRRRKKSPAPAVPWRERRADYLREKGATS